MASANLDFARSLYAAWERGDWSSAEWAHPEIEFVIVGGPTPGSWKGVAGMVEGFRGILNAWDEFRVQADEYRELDDERVLVFVRYSGHGKRSGLELERMDAKVANLLRIRDGKVTSAVIYFDRERAFDDLGLPPEAGSSHS
jgi:ketosteroid isomerase-like protein